MSRPRACPPTSPPFVDSRRTLSSHTMIHTTTVSLAPADVLARAQEFFAERVPHAAAFLEKSGPGFVTLRGQGGEEVVVSAWEEKEQGVTRVRGSTLFFDQALDRFLSTLPLTSGVDVA